MDKNVPPGQSEPETAETTLSSSGSYVMLRSIDPRRVEPVLTRIGILILDPILPALEIGAPEAAPRSTSPTSGSRLAKNDLKAVAPLGLAVAVNVTLPW